MTLPVGTLNRVAAPLGIRIDVVPRWHGGDLDRLLNAGHSAMHEEAAALFDRLPGWQGRPEVSFSIYGERGVIDILAFHLASGALVVIELKTELVDVQALIRSVDRYRRLAPRIAREAGWDARHVSSWVLLRESATNRRRVRTHATALRSAFAADGRAMRSWLLEPTAPIHALSFLPRAIAATSRPSIRRVRPVSEG